MGKAVTEDVDFGQKADQGTVIVHDRQRGKAARREQCRRLGDAGRGRHGDERSGHDVAGEHRSPAFWLRWDRRQKGGHN